jgi:hypothetical protein
MKLGVLKNIVGANLIGLHLIAIFLCYAWLQPRLPDPQQLKIVVLMLTPVTIVYAMAYFREVVRGMFPDGQDPDDVRMVTMRFAVLVTLFTFAFSIGIIHALYQYKSGTTATPDDLKENLAYIEAALGVFLGLIVETLFGKSQPKDSLNKSLIAGRFC